MYVWLLQAKSLASKSLLDNSQTTFDSCEHPYQKFLRTLNKYHNVTAAVLQFYILFFRRLLSNGSLYFTNVLHPRSAQGLYQCVVSVNGLGTMVSRTAQLIVAGRAYFHLPQKSCNGMCNEASLKDKKTKIFWYFLRTDCTFHIDSIILKSLNFFIFACKHYPESYQLLVMV